MEHNDDLEPSKVYPSRRSWHRFDKTASNAGLLEEASPILFQLASAFVGVEAAVALNDFIKNYDRQVTVNDVLTGKAVHLTNGFTEVEHLALVQKLENSSELKDTMTNDHTLNLFKYMKIVPSEVFMPLWTAVGKLNQENAIALHSHEIDGVSFKNLLVERLTGKAVSE